MIHEQLMWWSLLPLSFVINNFLSQISCHCLIQQNNRPVSSQRISIISYMNRYCSYLYFNHPPIFSRKSCVTVFYNRKSTILVLYQQALPLFSMDIRALLLRSPAPPSGGLPPPASDGGRVLGLCSGYIIIYVNVSMCQCVHKSDVNIT